MLLSWCQLHVAEQLLTEVATNSKLVSQPFRANCSAIYLIPFLGPTIPIPAKKVTFRRQC